MMAKKHEDHTTSVDSPPVEGGRDVSTDSPRRESAPDESKDAKPIQSDTL